MNCMWPAAWIQLRLSYSQPKIYNKLKMEKNLPYIIRCIYPKTKVWVA